MKMPNLKTISIYSNCYDRNEVTNKIQSKKKSLRYLWRPILRAVLFLGLPLANMSAAMAGSLQTFNLDGVSWHVPAEFVYVSPTTNGDARSFSLRYELPNFSAVNLADFKGVYPEDDRPILTVEVSYNQNSPAPATLLNKYIAEAEKDCPSCTNSPSSVGGTEYATFNGRMGPAPYSPDGVLFRLYEYPNSNRQFSICQFGHDLAPLECEMKQKISTEAILTIYFPIEFVTEGPDLMSHMVRLFDSYQATNKQGSAITDNLINVKPMCWHPAPGTAGADTIPLKIGPETWRIPRAYGSTFGLNRTTNPMYDSISFWLKLPDLEPLSSADPSPVVIRGSGNYISITIGYDSRKWNDPGKSGSIANWIKSNNYIGKNAFINYFEYQSLSGKSDLALNFLYRDSVDFIKNNDMLNLTVFPPEWFQCNQFGSAPNPLCQFRVSEFLMSNGKINYDLGRYDIQYSFSRDYFSQIKAINACMENLYQVFRYGKSN